MHLVAVLAISTSNQSDGVHTWSVRIVTGQSQRTGAAFLPQQITLDSRCPYVERKDSDWRKPKDGSSVSSTTNSVGFQWSLVLKFWAIIFECRLEGKVTIITGGASGIGEATVRLFTKHGAKLIIADVADAAGKKLAESLSPPAIFVHCDVTNEQDVGAAVDLAVEKHGQLDIMFNNAGIIAPGKTVAEFDMDQFDRVMKVNVRGVMVGMKHAARVMIPRKKGTIINTASITSVIGGLCPYDYTTSKHAVIGLTRNGAAELGKYGIRVNAVSPYGLPSDLTVGYFKKEGDPSSFSKEVDKPAVADFCTRVANLEGTVLTAEDVAEACLYMASDESKYVSGHNLVVDGGISVVNHSWGTYR